MLGYNQKFNYNLQMGSRVTFSFPGGRRNLMFFPKSKTDQISINALPAMPEAIATLVLKSRPHKASIIVSLVS